MTSGSFYSFKFCIIAWLVVLREIYRHCSVVLWADCPGIAHINDVNIVVHSHDKVGTRARFAVLELLGGLILVKNFVDVIFIAYLTTLHDGLVHVHGEVWLHDNLIMKVLFQILGALIAAMTIINRENLDLRPLIIGNFGLLCGRLNNVENDSDSVLICFPHETNMCVGCERPDDSEPLIAGFWVLEYSKLRTVPYCELLADTLVRLVINWSGDRIWLSILRRHCWFIWKVTAPSSEHLSWICEWIIISIVVITGVMHIWSLWLINCFVWWWLRWKWLFLIHPMRTTWSLHTSSSIRLAWSSSLVSCSLLLMLNSSRNLVSLEVFSVSVIFTINLLLNHDVSRSHLLSAVLAWRWGSLRSIHLMEGLSVDRCWSTSLATYHSVSLHFMLLHSILIQVRWGVLMVESPLSIVHLLPIKFMRFYILIQLRSICLIELWHALCVLISVW